VEYDLVLTVGCALHLHGFSCTHLIEPGISAAGEETVELSTYEPAVLSWSGTRLTFTRRRR